MSATLTTYDAALKDDYTPGLREAVNNSNVVTAEVTRNTDDIVGRKALWSVHHGRSSGTGSRAEGGTLPTAGNQAYEDPSESLRFHYHTIKVSGPALELTKNDKGAFVRALESEMKGADKDLRNNFSRQVVAGRYTAKTASATVGRTGTIAFVLAADTYGGADPIDLAAATTRAEMRFFFVGQVVDVVTTLTGAVLATRTITAIDKTSAQKTITVSGADDITTVAGDSICVSGSYDAEMPGLPALINDNAGDKIIGANVVLVHNVSSGTVPAWASPKVGSSTSPISEDLLMQAWDAIATDGDGNDNDAKLLVGAFEQARTLANKLQAQKRYDGRQVTLESGWRGLDVARGVLVTDKYALDNDMFLINTSELALFVGLDFTFDDKDGKVLDKALDGTDAFEARMKAYCTLAATNRNSHARIALQAV